MLTAFFRTVILYLALMLGLRMLGKRQIADLEPSELVLTLTISDLAAVPMQDYGIPLFNGLFPIITILCLSMLVSFFSLKSVRFRAFVCGTPTFIIKDGVIQQRGMQKNRLTLDELFEQLRTQGYSDLAAVKYAILETSGQLSILPYTKDAPLTPGGAQCKVEDRVTIPGVIIDDGRILEHNLAASGYDRKWLSDQLREKNIVSHREVFLFTVDEKDAVICIKKEAAK